MSSANEDAEKYRLLFEVSEDPMWVIIDQKFELCNDAAVRHLGYSTKQELQSTHPSQLSPEYQADGKSSYDKAEEMMAIALKDGYNRFEWIHTRKNGEDFPVEVTLTRMPYRGRAGIFCVWRDITDRKNLENELIEARKTAEDANKSKSKFLSMMSHELRTPLNAIIGFSEMLKQGVYGPLNKKQIPTIESINEGGELLLHLVDDLLNMAKIEQGDLCLKIENVLTSEIIANSIRLVENLANKNQVTIHCETLELDTDCLYADRVRSEQILVNLLTNAIKYNPGGNVWVITSTNADFVRISVKDDGEGIHEEHFKHIFNPFYRGDKTSSGIEGAGLGLPICKKLSEKMNGHCGFDSKYGMGATFWFELPLCEGCRSCDQADV